MGVGTNLEIFIFDNNKKIKVEYNGRNVYEEMAGDLELYVPYKEWEDKIESIYKLCKTKEKNINMLKK